MPNKHKTDKYTTRAVTKNPERVNVKYNGVWLKKTSNHITAFPTNGIAPKNFIAIPYNKDKTANKREINIAWEILNIKKEEILFLMTWAKTSQIMLKIPNV